ncbi:MAG: phenylacetate--CoA ligase family protein [Candidatus Aureabacteria bacterium]|nr:phenylacetate--CoA ligase family protein [Candidatus Auribacterota bacterium]
MILQQAQDLICKSRLKKSISSFLPSKRGKWELYHDKKKLLYIAAAEIRDVQGQKLRKLLKQALNSHYYSGVLEKTGLNPDNIVLEDLKKLPLLTKDIIREQGDRLLAKPKSMLYRNASGGSTGAPVIFYQDDNYADNIWATMMVILEMCGWHYGARIARLWGAPQDKRRFKTLKGRLIYFLQNTRFYDSFNMSEENMLKYHYDMTKHKPDIIICYASSIYLLAKFLKKRGLSPSYPSISINTSAETLMPHMRHTLEEVFGREVYDKYGSREISGIACECSAHKGLHIFEDNVILECLDPVTGENVYERPGELVITDLNNMGMPFIRYRIGDMGVVSREKCSCGRNTMMLRKVLGRVTDNFYLEGGRIVHGEYFTHLFYGTRGIKNFRFTQNREDDFLLTIVKGSDYTEGCLEQIIRSIKKVIGESAALKIEFTDKISVTATGKYRFTVSKVKKGSL